MPRTKKPFKITTKHRKLVFWWMRTGTIKDAAKVAGYQYTHACELLKKPELTALLSTYQEREGVTDELLNRAHVELLTQREDRSVRLGAVRLGYQLKKKIGSDEAPPPAILPAVLIRIDNGPAGTTRINAPAAQQRGLPAHGPASISISIPAKP